MISSFVGLTILTSIRIYRINTQTYCMLYIFTLYVGFFFIFLRLFYLCIMNQAVSIQFSKRILLLDIRYRLPPDRQRSFHLRYMHVQCILDTVHVAYTEFVICLCNLLFVFMTVYSTFLNSSIGNPLLLSSAMEAAIGAPMVRTRWRTDPATNPTLPYSILLLLLHSSYYR